MVKKFWLFSIMSEILGFMIWILVIYWAIFANKDYSHHIAYWIFFPSAIVLMPVGLIASITCMEFTSDELTIHRLLVGKKIVYPLKTIDIIIADPTYDIYGFSYYCIRISDGIGRAYYGDDKLVYTGKIRLDDFISFAIENNIPIVDKRIH